MSILFHGARKLDADGLVDGFWMLVDGDTITSTGSGAVPEDLVGRIDRVDVAGNWLVPGFIDLHGHGGGGCSFDGTADDIRVAIAAHRAHGTTRSVLSLVSNPHRQLEKSLALIAELAESDSTILGAHLEGPFLSRARKGAHNETFLIPPEPAVVERLIDVSRGTLRQITLAPELENALDAIDVLVAAGVAVAVGHTDANFDLARNAFDRGARILTHAFNAMNGIHHRAPGPVVAAFEDDRVTVELILDGHHVHPDVAALTFREAPDRVALITDAMAAAAASDGDYLLGSLAVRVRDGIATLADTGAIAGSTLTQDVALRNAVNLAEISLRDAVAALTLVPARTLGLDHRFGLLKPGFAADAVILDHELHVDRVWAQASLVSPDSAH